MIVNLNKYGESLGTRELALNIYNEIKLNEDYLKENIVFDFKGVSTINNSFADELFAKRIEEIGLKEFKKKFKFKNTNKNLEIVLKNAIISRIS